MEFKTKITRILLLLQQVPRQELPLQPLQQAPLQLAGASASAFAAASASSAACLASSSFLLFFRNAFLGFLARLRLVRIVAGFALHQTCGIQNAGNAVGRLGTFGKPDSARSFVEHNALAILWQHRIEGAEFFDVAAIARCSAHQQRRLSKTGAFWSRHGQDEV